MNETAKNDWQRIRSVFEDVLQQPAEERSAYAQKLCGTNEILWNEVRSLLDWHESSESFLETPAVVQVVEDNQLPDQLFTGQRLLHYEIQKLIGKGGMGEVYLAHDTRLDRNVAVKILRRDLLPHVLGSERLLREARAAALLEHPNICHIYEISEADGFNFIVMQYVVGTTLDDILAGGGVHVDTALEIGAQIAEGLAEAHSRGIIHRDIKPANIIISEKMQVKILDFGLAKFIEAESPADAASRMESTGGVMGTVPYMSPEQLNGRAVDARTDVFSFGSLLFEMLSGTSPFRRERNEDTISAILTEEPGWSFVSPVLRPLLERCLAKGRENRYASAVELAETIVRVRNYGPIENPTWSNPTASNRIDAVTQSADLKTLPLYAWQSGREGLSRPSHASDAELTGLSESRLRGWLAIGGTVFTVVALALGSFVWQRLPVLEVSRSAAIENVLVAIPGGMFTMGRFDGNDIEKPEHAETVMPFMMDKTEVTNAEYYEFMKASSYKPTSTERFLIHWENGRPIEVEDYMPVRYVNIDDVNAFANWRSYRDSIRYRLPTEQEWEFVARNGTKGNLYPWGDAFDARCAFVDRGKNEPVSVGSTSCPNAWGVFDLIGNVMEWTSSTAWVYPGSPLEIKPGTEARYMVRGGSAMYKSTGPSKVTSTFRVDTPASTRHPALGFRLVTSQH